MARNPDDIVYPALHQYLYQSALTDVYINYFGCGLLVISTFLLLGPEVLVLHSLD